jgi:hypothetical protein
MLNFRDKLAFFRGRISLDHNFPESFEWVSLLKYKIDFGIEIQRAFPVSNIDFYSSNS